MHRKEGNLMPHLFDGTESVSSDIRDGMTPLPRPTNRSLQSEGTLFREFRFKQGPTAHVSAQLAALSGSYITNGHDPKMRPAAPTVFELYRKHNSPSTSPLNAWWVADRSDPFAHFNHSLHESYGGNFAANFIQPKTLLSRYNPQLVSELNLKQSKVDLLSERLNQLNPAVHRQSQSPLFRNHPQDGLELENFIRSSILEAVEGKFDDPFNIGSEKMNDDMLNVFHAERILKQFKPELLVVNMIDIDRAHTNFTLYCDNMRKADFAVAHLWQTIQSTAGLKDDTILIALPEHGRNLEPNTLRDQYGRLAIDHTGDATSREIFCLIAGPKSKVKQNQLIHSQIGESIDLVPTIAEILGFRHEIPLGLLSGRHLHEAFN